MCLRAFGKDRGDIVMTLFGNHAVSTVSVTDTSATPKKHGWLPLLTMLFLISYGLMTMLIVEQGQTIESQRALIRELFRDSKELSSIKTLAQQQGQSPSVTTQAPAMQIPSAQRPSAQAPSMQIPSTQIPSTQYPSTQTIPSTQYPSTQTIPSTQAPNRQAPSSQAGPQHRAPNAAATQNRQFRMPSKPTPDLVDDCRTLITI
jgi:hypothetical protein